MLGLKDLSIHFLSGTPVLDWLALVVLVALSVYLYRRTNPPVSAWLRATLFALRTIAVLALILALLEPVVSYNREFDRERRVSMLVDASSSMDRVEDGRSRADRLDSLLSLQQFEQVKGAVDLKTYYFGDSLSESAAQAGHDRTALGDAVSELEQREMAEPADYRLILSDGRSNAGRAPDEVLRGTITPIISVNMATDLGNFDIGLADVQYNAVVFAGQPTEISVKLNWHNAAGKTPRVELIDKGKVVADGMLPINQDAGYGDLTLRFVPDAPGQKLLQIRIPTLDGEENTTNNRRTIALKVLKSRIATLLVTARPDYEVGFLKRFLEKSDKYDVNLIVTGTQAGNLAGRFPDRQTELNRYDLVILYDPDPQDLASRKDLINSYLAEKGGAVWVMMGEEFTSRGQVDWFDKFLPFYQSRRIPVQYREFHGEPAENELFHPAVRLADDRASIRDAWASVPPFKMLVRCDTIDPNGVILAYAGALGFDQVKLPILGYKRFGPGKLIASAAGPFWYWGFVNLGFGEDDTKYGKFLEGAISWLTVSEDFDPLRIAPVKDVFNRGEVVGYDGVAFDQGFRPIPGVTGTVHLTGEKAEDRFEADLIEQEPGRYRAELTQIPPGKYSWKGRLEKDGRLLKENSGVIQVEEFSLEEFDQSGDPATLMALSRISGGSYFTFDRFGDALRAIDTKPVSESLSGEVTVWGKFWLLIVLIVALAVEWIFRKIGNLL